MKRMVHEMTQEGNERERALHNLSEIFRVMVKSVTADTANTLAPGEIGIDFDEWTIYAKHPITDEIITPNSLAYLRSILKKYDIETGELSADKISGFRVYTSVDQLPQLGHIQLTVDSIIRQMAVPSLFIGIISHDNPDMIQIPSHSGILEIIKLDEQYVSLMYTDQETSKKYDGIYDYEQRLFGGWSSSNISDTAPGSDITVDDETITITTDTEIKDLSIVTIRTPEKLVTPIYVKVNGIGPFELLNINGNVITETVPANKIIMLMYDEFRHAWILLRDNQSSDQALIETMSNRIKILNDVVINQNNIIDGLNQNLQQFKQSTSQDLQTIWDAINTIKENPIGIHHMISTYIATEPIPQLIPIDSFDSTRNALIVNLGQTVLREGIDYDIIDNQLKLKNIILLPNTTLHFVIIDAN